MTDDDVLAAMSEVDAREYRNNLSRIDQAEHQLYYAKKENRELRAKWRRKMRRAAAK